MPAFDYWTHDFSSWRKIHSTVYQTDEHDAANNATARIRTGKARIGSFPFTQIHDMYGTEFGILWRPSGTTLDSFDHDFSED